LSKWGEKSLGKQSGQRSDATTVCRHEWREAKGDEEFMERKKVARANLGGLTRNNVGVVKEDRKFRGMVKLINAQGQRNCPVQGKAEKEIKRNAWCNQTREREIEVSKVCELTENLRSKHNRKVESWGVM